MAANAEQKGVVFVGLGYESEGKSKLIDGITQPGDVVVRAQGAGIIGHHVKVGGKEYDLHHIPVGILRPGVKCYLAGGMVLDAPLFFKEIKSLEENGITDIKDRLRISTNSHLQMPYHRTIDSCARKAGHVRGSSIAREGVHPCAAEKRFGIGIRLADLFQKIFQNFLNEQLIIQMRSS